MPFVIPLTDKQRAAMLSLSAEVQAIQRAANVYTQAVIDACPDAPTQYRGVTLTDAGLVLGDLPQPPAPTP